MSNIIKANYTNMQISMTAVASLGVGELRTFGKFGGKFWERRKKGRDSRERGKRDEGGNSKL